MAMEVRKYTGEAFPKSKPTKRGSYLEFIRSLPCVVTGARTGIQSAHLSFAATRYGHYGRGKGTKAPDRWALPISAAEHRRQHGMNEQDYWKSTGLDPHVLALSLFGLWADMGDQAYPHAEAIINMNLAANGRLRDRSLS